VITPSWRTGAPTDEGSGVNERSEDKRRFIAALIGGQVGAAIGLIFFGGLLFVPLLIALMGSAAGPLWLVGRGWARKKLAKRYLRTVLRS
jgi:hypothetical protein